MHKQISYPQTYPQLDREAYFMELEKKVVFLEKCNFELSKVNSQLLRRLSDLELERLPKALDRIS